MRTLELALPDFLKKSLSAQHPWVYRDHVPRQFQAADGAWVRITAGGSSAIALWDQTSPIALRVYSSERVPDAAWVQERVERAWELRAPLRERDTTAFRWLFGEGDGLPGITVDLYGQYAVIATYASSVATLLPWVVEALQRVTELRGVLRRRRSEEGDAEGRLELLAGRLPPRELIVEEYGVRLVANVFEGQKTGLFLDHRENRRFVRELSRGRRVLNLFSYTGAFSVNAALGGATSVASVDIAAPSAEAARRNFELNGVANVEHDCAVADVFAYLDLAVSQARRFDVVICDPPSFAKNKDQLPQALKAYTRVNAMGLRATEPYGYYAAASCTSQVSPEAFRDVLAEAARQAKRRFQIIHEAGQPLDHPVLAQHREGRYLKFVVGRALPAR